MAVCNVADAFHSTRLLSATTLRNVLGTKNMSELLTDRDHIAETMQVKTYPLWKISLSDFVQGFGDCCRRCCCLFPHLWSHYVRVQCRRCVPICSASGGHHIEERPRYQEHGGTVVRSGPHCCVHAGIPSSDVGRLVLLALVFSGLLAVDSLWFALFFYLSGSNYLTEIAHFMAF